MRAKRTFAWLGVAVVAFVHAASAKYDIFTERERASQGIHTIGHKPKVADGDIPPGREENMPKLFPMLELLLNWAGDDVNIPETMPYDSLERLDYQNATELKRAFFLRDLEIPHKVYNIPNLELHRGDWASDNYVEGEMEASQKKYRVNLAPNAHHMFYPAKLLKKELQLGKRPATGYKTEKAAMEGHHPAGFKFAYSPPVPRSMSFTKFWRAADTLAAQNPERGPGRENYTHLYLTVRDDWSGKEPKYFLGRDIDVFRSDQDNLFMWNASHGNGMDCRFGMRGVIAENHYDSSLNYVVMLRGRKRYILAPPADCQFQFIMPRGPGRRHSWVDFADIGQITQLDVATELARARTLETIMNAGEALYLPGYWGHHIVSLEKNIQCNMRSGGTPLFGEEADVFNACERGEQAAGPAKLADRKRAKLILGAYADKWAIPKWQTRD